LILLDIHSESLAADPHETHCWSFFVIKDVIVNAVPLQQLILLVLLYLTKYHAYLHINEFPRDGEGGLSVWKSKWINLMQISNNI
jgi:hypothetical protein